MAGLLPPRFVRKMSFPGRSYFYGVGRRLGAVLFHLSADVALGAVAGSGMAARLTGVRPTPAERVALLAAVATIYAADRLSDVRGLSAPPPSARHRFFWRHARLLTATCAAGVATGATAALFLPVATRRFGVGLSACALLYLWLARKQPERRQAWFCKELFVAVLYTAGVWGPALARGRRVPGSVWTVAAAYAAVALHNLLLFSWHERAQDARMGQPSLTARWSERRWQRANVALVVAVAALLATGVRTDGRVGRAGRVVALLEAVLVMICQFPTWFARRQRYRRWADAVFYLPVLAR